MSKKGQIQTNASTSGGAAAAASDAEVLACLAEIKTLIAELCEKIVLGDDSTALAEIIAQLMQLCDKLLANGDTQTEILAELQALCDKILAGNESLAEVVAELAALCEKLNTAIAALEALCAKIEAQTDLIASAMCPEICPVGGAAGGAVEYVNDDNTTDIAVSVGGAGDIKIELSGDESDATAVADFITECLAAGTDVSISWTNLDGGAGSATLLAAAETTGFPGFYNQSTDAAGESGKLQTLTASHANVEPSDAMVLKTHDQCVLNAIEDLSDQFPQLESEECCTEGATAETANCYNAPRSWLARDKGTFDRCTWSIAGNPLPDDSYTQADFEAALPAGAILEDNDDPDSVTVYTSAVQFCYQAACFQGNVGQLTRACLIPLPNTTEPECVNYLRTWGKYEEPIGNTLATSLAVQEELLAKQCELNDFLMCRGEFAEEETTEG